MAPISRKAQVAGRRVLGQLPLDPQARRQWRQAQRIIFLALCVLGIWILYTAGSGIVWLTPRLIAKFMPHWSPHPISSAERARMQEVADLMLDIYNTLAEMRYIDPSSIIQGPHNITYNQATFAALGLDPAIIYLYSILPYIDVQRAGRSFFFDGGRFTDFRNPNKVREGRDPLARSPQGTNFYAEKGPYMRPWMTPLSEAFDNYSGVLIYDARKHKIWILDMDTYESRDPKFLGLPDASGNGPNMNAFEHLRGRRASDVLKDINRWYRELEILPNDFDSAKWSDEGMDLATIYRKNGWPDKFNGDGFQADQIRRQCAISAEYTAEQPMRELEQAKSWSMYYDGTIPHINRAISLAESEDEAWKSRFELWKLERARDRHESGLPATQQAAQKYCPGGICQRHEDLPLWELHCLREEYAQKRTALLEMKKYIPYENDVRLIRATRDVSISYIALKASQADADRLRPGAELYAPLDDTKNDFDEQIRRARQDAHDYREFLATIPSSAENTRALVEQEAENVGWDISRIEQRKALHLQWEKEEKDREEMREEIFKVLE